MSLHSERSHRFLGVDVQRFMKDNEYKRETVLGLAM